MENSKIALVTGGSRGLGRDMSLNLARKGLDVVLTYHNNQEAAQEVVQQIEALGRKALALQLNTADTGSFDGFFTRLQEGLKTHFGAGKFDFLVNNAGTGGHTAITDTTEQQFDDLLNVHFKGVYFLTQKALPHLNDGGGIVNISSGLTRIVYPGAAVYGSLKTAVETLTKYMAKEFGPRRIRVNVVAPGAIETDFGGGRVRDDAQTNAYIASQTALGRVGLPDDIGSVVAFLCSDDAKWINAQRIEVSGGQMI